MTVCECGIHRRVHASAGCRVFTPAADPEAAAAAAHAVQVERLALVNTLRRAAARQQWDTALGAVLALQQLDQQNTYKPSTELDEPGERR